MELRVTALLLVVCAIIFTTTEGGIPQCCVRVSSNIPCKTLHKVEKYEVQEASGSCDTVALRLHMKSKIYCADPRYDKVLNIPKKSQRKWVRDCKKMIKKLML
ncbi:C-C motif chemokine 27a [Colossoma macropomum]|uniref:C-C motif chemokine 27a n=1 Tax=Colossoma macropomum TaxID=42526 RepID=UPI0018643A14|nr:C-C motif chemokine 27a [Colossoma macropomum]